MISDKPNSPSQKSSHSNYVLGPLYSSAKVAKLCGEISQQALTDRRERRAIFGLTTTDGIVVYPPFQFDTQNLVLRGLPECLQALQDVDVDGWTIAGWLLAPSRVLKGRSVVEWLRSGRDFEPAVALARDAARRFSQ